MGSTTKNTTSRLTDEEIRKLLAMGAKPSDHTSIPDEEPRCLELIRQTLYTVWMEPSREEAGTAEALVSLTFAGNGVIVGRKLVRPSGNATFDASVEQAMRTIQQIPGLTPAFLSRHASVTISFKLE